MAKYLMLNSKILPSTTACLTADNRGLLYADTFTHTVRGNSSKVFLVKQNFDFIIYAMKKLEMSIPGLFKMSIFATDVELLLQKNRIYKGFRADITVFRNPSSGKLIAENSVSILIQVSACEDEWFTLNKRGLRTAIAKKFFLPDYQIENSLSPIFSKEYFISKINDFSLADDWMLTSKKGVIQRTVDSIVVFVSDNKIIIPKAVNPEYQSVFLSFLISIAGELGYYVYKGEVVEKDLPKFDEMFLVNPVDGIRWVLAFKEKRYFHKVSGQLVKEINQRLQMYI